MYLRPDLPQGVSREQPAEFRRAVGETFGKGGVTWIPCFSLDRTQKILYELHLAQQERLLPEQVPIYCPSPTAKEATALYKDHRRSGWFSPTIEADADAFSPRGRARHRSLGPAATSSLKSQNGDDITI